MDKRIAAFHLTNDKKASMSIFPKSQTITGMQDFDKKVETLLL